MLQLLQIFYIYILRIIYKFVQLRISRDNFVPFHPYTYYVCITCDYFSQDIYHFAYEYNILIFENVRILFPFLFLRKKSIAKKSN